MKLRTKFQDEGFELGEVVDVDIDTMPDGRIKLQGKAKAGGVHTFFYDSLEKFYNDWEDAPELKGIVRIEKGIIPTMVYIEYSTEEEAEKAVEKLKAWERLKDKGFEFCSVERYEALCGNGFDIPITATMPPEAYTDVEVSKDLDILFGGEE